MTCATSTERRSRTATALLGILLTLNLVACSTPDGGIASLAEGRTAEGRAAGATTAGRDRSPPPPAPTAEVGTIAGRVEVDELGKAGP